MHRHVMVAAAATAVLCAATVYELVLVAASVAPGPQSGDAVAGAGIAYVAALLAMALGIGIALLRPSRAVAALAPSAAAFLGAFVSTFDPYYAPTLRRYADGGLVPVGWVVVVAVAALGAGALAWVRPRTGAVITAAVLAVLVLTVLFAPAGH